MILRAGVEAKSVGGHIEGWGVTSAATMKKAGRLDLSSSKPLPSSSLYRSQSMGQIPRPAPLQVQAASKRRPEDERLSPAKVRAGSRSVSGANSVAGGEQTVLRQAYVKPEGLGSTHRLSIDGNMGIGGHFQQPPEPPPRQPQKTSPRPQVVSSSRELLSYVRTHHPSPSEPIKLPSVLDRGDPDLWNPSKSREKGPLSYTNSRQAKGRYPGSMSVLPTAGGLQRTVAKFSYRTRTGSVGGVQKPQNQDNFVVITDFIGCKNQMLLGVFDGHGKLEVGMSGHEVSMFIKKTLPVNLENYFPRHLRIVSSPVPHSDEIAHLRTTFVSAFTTLNNELLKKTSIDSSFSGSTLVSVLLRGNLAICGNAGDSRAILGSKIDGHWAAVPLSNDHKPDSPGELERIEKCGGRVEPYMGDSSHR